MTIFLGIVLVSVLLLVIIHRLPGRRERKCAIFIAADPKTVWNAYFSHERGCDYRPGRRLLSSEILSHGPLTVRDTWQSEFLSRPVRGISFYEIYEPYDRYRVRGGIEPAVEPPFYEDGELRHVAPLHSYLAIRPRPTRKKAAAVARPPPGREKFEGPQRRL